MNLEIAKEKLKNWDTEYLIVSIKKHPNLESYYFDIKLTATEELGELIEESIASRVFDLSETNNISYYTEKFKTAKKLKAEEEEIRTMQYLMKKYIKDPTENNKVLTLRKSK